MSIRKYCLFVLVSLLSFFFSANVGFSQKVEVSSKGFFIDGHQLGMEATTTELKNILGEPDRRFLGESAVWIYDELGIKIYVNPADESDAQGISFNLTNGNPEHSPRLTFGGQIFLCDYQITKYTPARSVLGLKELIIDSNLYDSLINARIGNIVVVFCFTKDKSSGRDYMDFISVSFK